MPRFFFDVRTRDRKVRDEIGIDLPDARAIWPEIARLVHDCAGTAPATDAGRLFDVIVRDEANHVVERCTTAPAAKARQP